MTLSNIQKFGAAAALSLATIFGATSAQAEVNFQPSPDGRFEQCLTRSEFSNAMTEMHQRPIAWWNAHKGGNTTYFVRGMVTGDIEGNPDQKKWIRWNGWDHNEAANGTKPEMFCVNGNGTGLLVLNIEVPEKMPSRPFGVSYRVPSNPDMGEGNIFIDTYVTGGMKAGVNPAIVMNNGNNTFAAIYAYANNNIDRAVGAVTGPNGSTRDFMDASGFQFAESVKHEFAEARPSRTQTALAYQSAVPAPPGR